MEDIERLMMNETEHYENAYIDGVIDKRIEELKKYGKKNISKADVITSEERELCCKSFVSGQRIGETVMAEKIIRELFKENLKVNINKLSKITGLTKKQINSLN